MVVLHSMGYGVLLRWLLSFMEKFPIVMSQEFLVTLSLVSLMVMLSLPPSGERSNDTLSFCGLVSLLSSSN